MTLWSFQMFRERRIRKHPECSGVRKLGSVLSFESYERDVRVSLGIRLKEVPPPQKKKITVDTSDTHSFLSASPVTCLTASCENKDRTMLMTCI